MYDLSDNDRLAVREITENACIEGLGKLLFQAVRIAVNEYKGPIDDRDAVIQQLIDEHEFDPRGIAGLEEEHRAERDLVADHIMHYVRNYHHDIDALICLLETKVDGVSAELAWAIASEVSTIDVDEFTDNELSVWCKLRANQVVDYGPDFVSFEGIKVKVETYAPATGKIQTYIDEPFGDTDEELAVWVLNGHSLDHDWNHTDVIEITDLETGESIWKEYENDLENDLENDSARPQHRCPATSSTGNHTSRPRALSRQNSKSREQEPEIMEYLMSNDLIDYTIGVFALTGLYHIKSGKITMQEYLDRITAGGVLDKVIDAAAASQQYSKVFRSMGSDHSRQSEENQKMNESDRGSYFKDKDSILCSLINQGHVPCTL